MGINGLSLFTFRLPLAATMRIDVVTIFPEVIEAGT
jgi:hypothetical protein